MNLKYSLKPSGDFWNLLLEDSTNGRCLIAMTFSSRKIADYGLENANSFLNYFEVLEKDFNRCKTSESARLHLFYCYGFLTALVNFLSFSGAERLFVEGYFTRIYQNRIGEIKNEACE